MSELDEQQEIRKLLEAEIQKNRELSEKVNIAVDGLEKITTVGQGVNSLEDAVSVSNMTLSKIKGNNERS